jgi:hypothetical protein
VSRRFVSAPPGTELRAYVVPQTMTSVKLLSSVSERIQVGKDFYDVVHLEAVWQIPGTGDLGLSITAMKDGGPGAVDRAVAGAGRGARRRGRLHVAHPGVSRIPATKR